MCALFVRDVFDKAGVAVASSTSPVDTDYLNPGDTLGPSYANSFFGGDVGVKIAPTGIQPGDLIGVHTLDDWDYRVITHVGIAVDAHHYIHRPTASEPVKKGVIPFGVLIDVRRPHSYKTEEHRVLKFFQQPDGDFNLIVDGAEKNRSLVSIDIGPTGATLNINGKPRKIVSMRLEEVKFDDQ